MKEVISLLKNKKYNLDITANSAGSVGKSSDLNNKNRKRLINMMGFVPENVYFVTQTHSKKVVDVSEILSNSQIEADGIISTNKNDIIAVTVADCMPIYLYDKKNDIRVLLHSGWKGTGIVIEAIEILKKEYNTCVKDISAYLGPSIKSCCYQVDKSRAVQFKNDWGKNAVLKKDDGWYLSIDSANLNILKSMGVNDITKSDECTCCNKNFGSYRRDGKKQYNQMFVISYLNQG